MHKGTQRKGFGYKPQTVNRAPGERLPCPDFALIRLLGLSKGLRKGLGFRFRVRGLGFRVNCDCPSPSKADEGNAFKITGPRHQ